MIILSYHKKLMYHWIINVESSNMKTLILFSATIERRKEVTRPVYQGQKKHKDTF